MSDLTRRLSAGFRRAEVEIEGERLLLRSLSAAGFAELADHEGESDVRRNARIISLCVVDESDARRMTPAEALELPPPAFARLFEAAVGVLREPGEQPSGN